MDRQFRQIKWDLHHDVYCVHLLRKQLDESQLNDLSDDLSRLLDEMDCCRMVLNLGPEEPLCLYSIFLAKLVNLQRRLNEKGGGLKLAHVGANTYRIFEACKLAGIFTFCPDQDSALADFTNESEAN